MKLSRNIGMYVFVALCATGSTFAMDPIEQRQAKIKRTVRPGVDYQKIDAFYEAIQNEDVAEAEKLLAQVKQERKRFAPALDNELGLLRERLAERGRMAPIPAPAVVPPPVPPRGPVVEEEVVVPPVPPRRVSPPGSPRGRPLPPVPAEIPADVQNELDELRAAVPLLRRDLQDALRDVAQARAQAPAVDEAELAQMRARLEAAEQQNNEQNKRIKDLSELVAQASGADAAASFKENQALREEIAALKASSQDSTRELSEAQSRREKLAEEIGSLRSELSSARAEIDGLKQIRDAMATDYQEESEACKKASAERDAAQASIENLAQDFIKLTEDYKNARQEIAQRDQQIVELRQQQQAPANEREELLQKQVAELEKQFDDAQQALYGAIKRTADVETLAVGGIVRIITQITPFEPGLNPRLNSLLVNLYIAIARPEIPHAERVAIASDFIDGKKESHGQTWAPILEAVRALGQIGAQEPAQQQGQPQAKARFETKSYKVAQRTGRRG